VQDGLERYAKGGEKNIMDVKKKEIIEIMTLLTSMCLEEYNNPLDRIKVETLVTIHVHQKDITCTDYKFTGPDDFDWLK
jgi:dynein heavy chain